MSDKKVRIVFKHWKTGKKIVREGTLPPVLNNPLSDRYLLFMENGKREDIIKDTIIEITDISEEKTK